MARFSLGEPPRALNLGNMLVARENTPSTAFTAVSITMERWWEPICPASFLARALVSSELFSVPM